MCSIACEGCAGYFVSVWLGQYVNYASDPAGDLIRIMIYFAVCPTPAALGDRRHATGWLARRAERCAKWVLFPLWMC